MRQIILLLLLVGVAACADSHSVQRVQNQHQRLSSDALAYISVPADGRYGATAYYGSGAMASQIVAVAFSRHLVRVEQALSHQDFDAALAAAREAKANYLIVPEILHWEDRATEWSGQPDHVELRISVIDVVSGKPIETAILTGTSGIGTLGGDHPQDLLPAPAGQYVAGLFN